VGNSWKSWQPTLTLNRSRSFADLEKMKELIAIAGLLALAIALGIAVAGRAKSQPKPAPRPSDSAISKVIQAFNDEERGSTGGKGEETLRTDTSTSATTTTTSTEGRGRSTIPS
jgi:hypothetical protein